MQDEKQQVVIFKLCTGAKEGKPAIIKSRENVSQSEGGKKTGFLQTNENLEDSLQQGYTTETWGLHKQMKISRNDENDARCQIIFPLLKITLKYNLFYQG